MGVTCSQPNSIEVVTKMPPPCNSTRTVNSVDSTDEKLEDYFEKFRLNICGHDSMVQTPQGKFRCIYADWTASGRCYEPIEKKIGSELSRFVANTHTETSALGHLMTAAYQKARKTVMSHVNAFQDDVMVATGSGMTGAVNKLQSILGLRIPERMMDQIQTKEKPLVLITHYEHHSNQISWENCFADVFIVPPGVDGSVSPANFAVALQKYSQYTEKYVSISACSNVTGIRTAFHEVAKVAHQHGAFCFVDFATSFGYVDVDMHPEDDPEKQLDAIFFSPHKLLGGPGSCGIVIFNKKLYNLKKPDICGGGTVTWTNPWHEQGYIPNIDEREDAGTPPFMQMIRAALAIVLKEEMGTTNILSREHEINAMLFQMLSQDKSIHILADNIHERLSIFSIYIDGLHYNLLAKLLNDFYGVQCRGGCNCAGTYAHVLFHIEREESKRITDLIDLGDNSTKPGWCRLSFHPTMSNAEVEYVCNAVLSIAKNFPKWKELYRYDSGSNQFYAKQEDNQWIEDTLTTVFSF